MIELPYVALGFFLTTLGIVVGWFIRKWVEEGDKR